VCCTAARCRPSCRAPAEGAPSSFFARFLVCLFVRSSSWSHPDFLGQQSLVAFAPVIFVLPDCHGFPDSEIPTLKKSGYRKHRVGRRITTAPNGPRCPRDRCQSMDIFAASCFIPATWVRQGVCLPYCRNRGREISWTAAGCPYLRFAPPRNPSSASAWQSPRGFGERPVTDASTLRVPDRCWLMIGYFLLRSRFVGSNISPFKSVAPSRAFPRCDRKSEASIRRPPGARTSSFLDRIEQLFRPGREPR